MIEPTASSEEPSRLPAAPGSTSRVDTLSEDFLKILSRRPFTAGDVIANRYRLLETLGDGGMGQVFVAENLSIGRRVAVKMLRAELLADATFRRRFQQEAQAIAAIEHRNVARFFDLVVGDPTFLVMEYVPGPTLASVVGRHKPLDPVQAINIARRLCWALDAAHNAGVIHRDIKPSNVILSPDVETGHEPKLIDFGLAKLASATAGEGLTRTGQIIGTPSYMSPEQIANQEVDARSDVYSLGCVLYEMLTGSAPFAGMEDVQVLYKQLHEDPPAPSSRVPLPPEVDAVIARSLAKDPEQRFGSMQEMATALAKIDRRRGPEGHIRTEPKLEAARPAYGLALAAFVVGALSAGGGVWFGSQQRASGGAILVTSRPAGATVDVDGRRWRETTPTAVSGLQPGRHTVHVAAEGHGALDQTVMLERNARASIELALPAIERAVAVQTIPAGALVFVDGHLAQGRTPLMVSVGQDDFHELRLELDGYETETRALKPEDHDPTVMVHLEPAREERGTLWVDGPATTEVYLDGAQMAPAPTIGLQVATGTHLVELRSQDGTVVAQKAIRMVRGQTLHVAPLDVARLQR